MYTKDKRQRITLRLNDDQMQYVVDNAALLDMSPSDYCRSIINLSMSVDRQAAQKIAENMQKGVFGRENDKTDIHHIV